MTSSSSSFSYLLLVAIIITTFSITTTTARPCKTFLISTYSLSITPENPNLSSSSSRFVTIFTIRRLNPNPNPTIPLFVNRRQPQIHQSSSLPFNINSFKDRTRDILSVVMALLFGVGCGALTAATMYLVWALVVNRQSYDFDEEEDDYENEASDEACLKKLGYVKIPSPAVKDSA